VNVNCFRPACYMQQSTTLDVRFRWSYDMQTCLQFQDYVHC